MILLSSASELCQNTINEGVLSCSISLNWRCFYSLKKSSYFRSGRVAIVLTNLDFLFPSFCKTKRKHFIFPLKIVCNVSEISGKM